MDLDTAKNLITKYVSGHSVFMARAQEGERYYRVQNDILFREPKNMDDAQTIDGANPLRQADNRIAFSFYQLLVNQKAGYMFTTPPLIDTGSVELNNIIVSDLGDAYPRKMKDLCVNASNAGVAWIHYWIDTDGFHYGVVPSYEVIPVWSQKLDKELLAVLRVYKDFDEQGDEWYIYEFWTDKECEAFRRRSADDVQTGLVTCPMFFDFYVSGLSEADNVLRHNYGRVPFIPFFNNNTTSRDLDTVKDLVDAYDKTFSGFVDDLEDIQEIIFVLTNYGGQNLKEFLHDLKYYKAIQVESSGDGDKSGVSTLSIDIPVEARDKLLEITRKAIFDMGQGIDPQQQGLDATSGEAMKFLYALLEIKAGLMETEFRIGLGELVRAIAGAHSRQVGQLTQTWTRTSIRNDAELVDMCSKSVGILSRKTILKNHPFVENAEAEEKQLDKEKQDANQDADIYGNDLGGGKEEQEDV